MLLMCYLFILSIGCGVVVFCSTRKHLLLVLLSLEFMSLSLFFILFVVMLVFGIEMFYSLMFLVFSVCEGSLGLAILVKLIRSHGNDHLSSMSPLSW